MALIETGSAFLRDYPFQVSLKGGQHNNGRSGHLKACPSDLVFVFGGGVWAGGGGASHELSVKRWDSLPKVRMAKWMTEFVRMALTSVDNPELLLEAKTQGVGNEPRDSLNRGRVFGVSFSCWCLVYWETNRVQIPV